MPARLILTAAIAASLSFSAAAGTECPADVSGDGVVGIEDFLQVLGEWGCAGCDSDIDGDGMTGINDFLQVLGEWGCEVNTGPVSTLSGTVTNLWTGDPIMGASVLVGEDQLLTDEFGDYSGDFTPGLYDVVFEAEHFLSEEQTIILFPDLPATLDAALEPEAVVIVNVIVPADAEPGGVVEVMADVEIFDGSTIQGYAWTQTAGTSTLIGGADMPTATLSLGTRLEYKEQLIHVLSEPPIGPDQLPPNVPPPPGEFPGGLQDRFQVVGVNPFALEEAGLVGVMVEVTTTSGTYSAEGDVHTHIPWKRAGGIRNVPIDVPVLLYGKDQAAYDWTLTRPNNSTATLVDASTQYPDFKPDVPGLYEAMVTGDAGTVTLQVYAGNWRGIIVGQDADGRPVPDSSCTGCHSNLGADEFAPWTQTGHAEIFTNNLNNSPYYNTGCFACHGVGYEPGAVNNGFDDAFDYEDFLAAGLLGNPGNNWTTMLDEFPWSAQMANIQCENCHGPQWGMLGVNTLAHGPTGPQGEPRVSLSADVCAVCHGEPLRHARFQQWQLSAHANYEVAIDEGDSGNCSRCHTANGFLTWLPILTGDAPGDPLDNIQVTWTSDEVHPQTCQTCHDPHASGTTSGNDNNATVRISGHTPPLIAGFTAYGVGRGAICMTCHNSRRGLRNDSTFDDYFGTSEAARAPHGSAQTDVLMGENGYLVTVGNRGNHSFLEDTCAQCHMVQTPPPDDLAYNSGGTNHTFFASIDICTNCHSGFDGPSVQAGVQETLDILHELVEEELLAYIAEQTSMGNIIDLNGDRLITDAAEITDLVFGEFRGRQAMTLTFTDNMTLGPYRMTDVDILNSAMVLLGQFYDFADPNLIKSGWNWALIHNDGSLGVHNPSYAYDVMVSAIASLSPMAASSIEWPEWLDLDPPSFPGN